jgi:hypothetical protein
MLNEEAAMSRILCAMAALAVLTLPASAYSGGCRVAGKSLVKKPPIQEMAGGTTRSIRLMASTSDDLETGSTTTPTAPTQPRLAKNCGESSRAVE